MEPIKGEEHPVKEEVSVLEQVIKERDLKYRTFENMIEHDDEFNIAIVTMNDEFIIELYNYLVKLEKKHSFMADTDVVDPRLERIKSMLLRLEDLAVVQEHMVEKSLTPEDVAQINETVALITERQKVRKMGPVQKLVYNLSKKRKTK